MTLKNFSLDTASRKPQSDRVVIRSTCNNVSIRWKGHRWYFFGVAIESKVSLRIGDVPEWEVIVDSCWYDILPR
jgi:hypothetical protein